MTERRRPRHVSTGTWSGLTAQARADLYASSFTADGTIDEPGPLEGFEQFFDIKLPREFEPLVRAIVTKAYLAGTDREAQLQSALQMENAIRIRLELILREHGIEVPTDPIKTDPPEV